VATWSVVARAAGTPLLLESNREEPQRRRMRRITSETRCRQRSNHEKDVAHQNNRSGIKGDSATNAGVVPGGD
jgi:hypothetical protein